MAKSKRRKKQDKQPNCVECRSASKWAGRCGPGTNMRC